MILRALASAATALAPLHAGVWSSMRIESGSGDYAGLKVRLSSPMARSATVTVCGDGCSGPAATPIVRDATGFGFALPRRDDADPAAPVGRCHARFARNVLVIACTERGLEEPLHRVAAARSGSDGMRVLENVRPRS